MKTMKLNNSELLGLLKDQLESQRKLNENCYRACVIYLIAMGIICKYAFDPDVERGMKVIISSFGIIFSIWGVISCWFGHKVREGIDLEVNTLNETLGAPLINTKNLTLFYALISCSSFDIIMILLFSLNVFYPIMS